jgi:hypothetical protein
MGDRYTLEDLRTATRMKPESRGLTQSPDEWSLGGIAVPRVDAVHGHGPRPTYRRGWTFAIEETMEFALIRFKKDSREDGVAVVLRGEREDYLAGWFNASRWYEAATAAGQLNAALEAERARCRNEPTITFSRGSEFAPDDPVGNETITVWSDDRLVYTRRKVGETVRRSGKADDVWAIVTGALERTPFPEPTQTDFVPGSTIRLAETGGRRAEVRLGEDDPRSTAYAPIIELFRGFMEEVRGGTAGTLAQLGFKAQPPPWEVSP